MGRSEHMLNHFLKEHAKSSFYHLFSFVFKKGYMYLLLFALKTSVHIKTKIKKLTMSATRERRLLFHGYFFVFVFVFFNVLLRVCYTIIKTRKHLKYL